MRPTLAKPAAHGHGLSNPAHHPGSLLSSPGGSAHACLSTSVIRRWSETKGHTSVIFPERERERCHLSLQDQLGTCQRGGLLSSSTGTGTPSHRAEPGIARCLLVWSCNWRLKGTLSVTPCHRYTKDAPGKGTHSAYRLADNPDKVHAFV